MTSYTWQWAVRMAVLWSVAWPGLSGAVEGGAPQDAAPAEEIGSRATPMLKQGLPGPLGNQILVQPGIASPPSCVKFLPGPSVAPQPIPSTHYYSIMPSTIRVSDAIRRTADALVQFTLEARQATTIQSLPQFLGNVGMNAPVLQVYAQESANPPQSELIGETQVHLPHGAIIRELSIGVRDNSSKQNLHAVFQAYIGDGRGAVHIELESDCFALGTYAQMGARNLAIPVDARQGHFLRLELVPAKAPGASPPGTAPSILVDLIYIGYTMP